MVKSSKEIFQNCSWTPILECTQDQGITQKSVRKLSSISYSIASLRNDETPSRRAESIFLPFHRRIAPQIAAQMSKHACFFPHIQPMNAWRGKSLKWFFPRSRNAFFVIAAFKVIKRLLNKYYCNKFLPSSVRIFLSWRFYFLRESFSLWQ